MPIHKPPRTVRIVEVGPRDGLQNVQDHIPTSTKLELIRRLEETGLRTIELTSIVSPKAIPQLADCREVLGNTAVKRLLQASSLRLPVLIPNVKGLEIAIQHGVKEIAVFISATEGFSKANINCTVEQSIERARQVASLALKSNIVVRGYVSCIFADPYDGPTAVEAVLRCTRELLDMGCYEVSLGDTIGVGSPSHVRTLITYLTSNGVPLEKLAGHFHDTYGQAVANVWEAYSCGMCVFDSSVGGLGGCPFAPGAKGNVASEDLVHMFHNAGIRTGVDLSKLADTGAWISQQLSRPNSTPVGIALTANAKSSKSPSAKAANVISSKETLLQWVLVSKSEGRLLYRSGMNLKIVLNRPKNGNALTAPMISELTKVINDTSRDAGTAQIFITVNGKFFCMGMDLGKGSDHVAQDGPTIDTQPQRLAELLEAIDRSPKVTTDGINGPVIGGGVGLAFCWNIRLCTPTATVTLKETNLGLCPATMIEHVTQN
ncbi:aldolase [Penicillium hispanicum]|uniref:aldolase n=1 Tax=Penicillium hispanicum TaxID=1080232 RepID=UPI00253FF332|nr:aldolase [Penicillium hispanicum]KAJ5584609.1 aldolase [Penicillium hispanicum]